MIPQCPLNSERKTDTQDQGVGFFDIRDISDIRRREAYLSSGHPSAVHDIGRWISTDAPLSATL